MNGGFHIVSTTISNETLAVELARKILEHKLGRCVQIIPRIRSIYHWDGEICDDDECLLLIKTPTSNLPHLMRLLPGWHPYEVPEIASTPVDSAYGPYLKWLDEWRYNDAP